MSHMRCRNCGDEQLETEIYCSNCGHALHHSGARRRKSKAVVLAMVLVPLAVLVLLGFTWARHAARVAGERALIEAARTADQTNVGALLDQGVSANVRDSAGETPLHLVLLAAQKSEEVRHAVADLLLTHRAAANAKDEQGVTPLHLAAAGGMSSVVGLLMSHGADVNVEDESHRTPLMAARKGLEDTAKRYNLNASDPSSLLILQGSVPELQGYLGTVELIQKRDKSELRALPSATTSGEAVGQ